MKILENIYLVLVLTLALMTSCSGDSRSATEGDLDTFEEAAEGDSYEDASDGDGEAEFVEDDIAGEGEADGSEVAEPESEEEVRSPDFARVFVVNPVTTPEPLSVELHGVADDLDGSLISSAAPDGCRLLQALSCVDEGATNTINLGAGPVTQRICTLRALADKYEHGNFDYEDWNSALNGTYDDSDVHAEVELYYHAQKMYAFLTQPAVGLWQRLPGRHEHGQSFVPLTLVANYRLPNPNGDLLPLSMAMFIPEEYRAMGMGDIYGLIGYSGDALIFAQGQRADFAYDGETVYHEFGHWVNFALAGLSNETVVDSYGFSNLGGALEQGLAETLVFLVSGRSEFFEYIDTLAGPGFMRNADNEDSFPDSLNGFDQSDGMILAGTNYEIYRLLEDGYDFDAARFARVILKSITALKESPKHDFKSFAELLLAEIENEAGTEAAAAAEAVILQRGLYEEARTRDISAYHAGGSEILYFGGTINKPWNTFINLQSGETTQRSAGAMVQTCLTVPQTDEAGALSVSAIIGELPDSLSMYPQTDDWDLAFLLRKGLPVEYTQLESGDWSAAFDAELTPQISEINTPAGKMPLAAWTTQALEPGAWYCLHLINRGDSNGVLMDIAVSYE